MIKSEILKLKKDTMFFAGTIIVLLTPVFMIVKDLWLTAPAAEISEWIRSCCLINFMMLSVLSGFIITNFIQREYQSGTLINILTSAVSRVTFVVSKLIVWFSWYFMMLVFIEVFTVLGSRILYPAQFNSAIVKMIVALFSKFGLLSFISSIPLLWITILQKKLFYPSILTAIGFTAILAGGMNISLKMILPASIIPWSAVSIVATNPGGSPYLEIGLASIFLIGLLGLFLSCFSFSRQDQ